MVQLNPPGDAIGHIVVIVEYDPVRGFKVKSSDENTGRLEWIPENRMTWYQYVVTEEEYQVVKYNSGGSGGVEIVENGQSFFISSIRVVDSLKRAHLNETGKMLSTDFGQRKKVFLEDFGFVLKFNKTFNCTGEMCNDSDSRDYTDSSEDYDTEEEAKNCPFCFCFPNAP